MRVERNLPRLSLARQRGQTIFLAAIFLMMGVLSILYVTVNTTSATLSNRNAEHDAKVLAQVKEALIGWSAARTPTGSNPYARPGELPCPDTDNNGYAENDDNNDGVDTASCVAGAVGRVPWKTLGIPEPRDSAGEILWYAISGNYRVYRSSTPNIWTAPITSDTRGTLTVYQQNASDLITSEAVAVLFAPGAALGTQDRSTTTSMSCAAPSGTYLRSQCASNYLDTYNGVNNASLNGPFIQPPPPSSSSTHNDRLLAITNEDLMPPVEQRVAREMISYLNAYKAATATSLLFNLIPLSPGVYPWADLADGDSNGSAGSAYNHNRFPCGAALPVDWNSSMSVWPLLGSGTTPTLPHWLTNGCASLTGWAGVIYYAVARNRLATGFGTLLTTCSTCSASTLTVTNAAGRVGTVCSTASPPVCTTQVITAGNADMLLITPGGYTGTPVRTWPTTWNDIVGYFEDAANYDNNNPNNDSYVVPTSTSHNRDRIFIVR